MEIVWSRHALDFILYRVFLYTFSQENGKMLMLSKTRETLYTLLKISNTVQYTYEPST